MWKLYLALIVAAVLFMPTASFANVFACDLHAAATNWSFAAGGTLSLYYRLNADCTSVTISLFDVTAPAIAIKTIVSTSDEYTSAGVHEYLWDGTDDLDAPVPLGEYSFSVTAEHDGFSEWTSIVDADTAYYPYQDRVQIPSKTVCDIKVVRDETSPYYGRVYFSVANEGVFLSNPVPAGLYAMNADLSCYDAANPRGKGSYATAHAACDINSEVQWVTLTTPASFPEQSNKFMSRRADGEPGFVITNGAGNVEDASQAIYLVDYDGSLISSPVNVDTNAFIVDPRHAYITGTGADRKLYVEDWEFTGPGARGQTAGYGGTPNIWCYAIGTADNDYSATPSLAMNVSALPGNNSNGKWRGNTFIPGVTDVMVVGGESLVVSNSNAAVLCELWPASAIGNTTGALSQMVWNVTRDRWIDDTGVGSYVSLTNTAEAISVSVDESTVYVGSYQGRWAGYDAETGASIAGTALLCDDGANPLSKVHLSSGADIDSVGNMLIAGYYYGAIQCWSPPGANSSTTSWASQGNGGKVTIGEVTSLEDWNLYR